MNPVQEFTERCRELAGLAIWCLIGHGLDLQLRWPPGRPAHNLVRYLREPPKDSNRPCRLKVPGQLGASVMAPRQLVGLPVVRCRSVGVLGKRPLPDTTAQRGGA